MGKLRNLAEEIDVCSFAVRCAISLFSHLLLISYPSKSRALKGNFEASAAAREWIFPGSMCFETSEQVSVRLPPRLAGIWKGKSKRMDRRAENPCRFGKKVQRESEGLPVVFK